MLRTPYALAPDLSLRLTLEGIALAPGPTTRDEIYFPLGGKAGLTSEVWGKRRIVYSVSASRFYRINYSSTCESESAPQNVLKRLSVL